MFTGKGLILLGLAIVALGVFMTLGGRLPWLGRLPGDLHFKHNGFSIYLPLTTSLIVSLFLALLSWLLRK